MQVREILSRDVVSVGSDATLQTAVEAMLENRVGSVLVVDAGLRGILTESDALLAGYRTERPFTELPVRRVMSTDLVTVTESTSVKRALESMREHGVKKLPVVDGLDVVGVVTVTDVGTHLPEALSEVRSARRHRGRWERDR